MSQAAAVGLSTANSTFTNSSNVSNGPEFSRVPSFNFFLPVGMQLEPSYQQEMMAADMQAAFQAFLQKHWQMQQQIGTPNRSMQVTSIGNNFNPNSAAMPSSSGTVNVAAFPPPPVTTPASLTSVCTFIQGSMLK
jgi:hypothetical protein